MVKSLLLALLLTVVQKEAKPPATGIIVGAVTVPEDTTLSQPLQVVLMSQKYLELWNAEVQRRLDGYWERFKPTFAQQREIFVAATERAYIESTQSVILRMRRELSATIGDFLQDSSPEGRFEFKNVPLGEYTVLAFGRVGDDDLIWQEPIEVRNSIPQFLQLKKRVP